MQDSGFRILRLQNSASYAGRFVILYPVSYLAAGFKPPSLPFPDELKTFQKPIFEFY